MAKAKARANTRHPWIKWYTRDWRADPPLRMCSYAARGLWADLLSLMAESRAVGFLLIEDVVPTCKQLAGLLGGTEKEIAKLRAELCEANVYSVTGYPMPDDVAALVPADMPHGVILSRRMVRDKAKADRDSENGKGGGNPNLIGLDNLGVNPSANPQKSEARDKIPEAKASGAKAPARDVLFSECLPYLIRKTGGTRESCARKLGQLLRDEGDNAAILVQRFQEAEQNDVADPYAWVKARLPSHTVGQRESWADQRAREVQEAIERSKMQ